MNSSRCPALGALLVTVEAGTVWRRAGHSRRSPGRSRTLLSHVSSATVAVAAAATAAVAAAVMATVTATATAMAGPNGAANGAANAAATGAAREVMRVAVSPRPG